MGPARDPDAGAPDPGSGLPDLVDPAALDRFAQRAQAGDREAFVALLEATERDLRIFVTCYATSLAMADEVVQGTYVTAFQRLDRYEPRGTLRAWLKGIARNLLMRELDQRRRAAPLDADLLEGLVAERSAADLARDDGEPERRAEHLRRCLERLAPTAQRLVHERYVQDRPVAEIARLVERSSNWVAVNLFRIRRTLLGCLRQHGVDGALAEGPA